MAVLLVNGKKVSRQSLQEEVEVEAQGPKNGDDEEDDEENPDGDDE